MNINKRELKDFLEDKLNRGKMVKNKFYPIIQASRAAYYKMSTEKDDKIKYKDRGIAISINDSLASVVRPFTSQKDPVHIDNKNTIGKVFAEAYGNYILEEMDLTDFLIDWTITKSRDGTAFIFHGWEIKKRKIRRSLGILTRQEYEKINDGTLEYEQLNSNKGRVYKLGLEEVESKPFLRVLNNDKVITDPDNCRLDEFVAIEIDVSKNYFKSRVKSNINSFGEVEEELFVDELTRSVGKADENERQKVSIYKIWATYNDEDLYIEITQDLEHILKCEPNYLGYTPVTVDSYIKIPQSTWGLGIAFLIGKSVDAREQITKDMLAIINKTKINTTAIKGNGISFTEMNRYKEGEEYVFVKDINAIRPLTPPSIPSSTMAIASMLSSTIDSSSRINRQTLDSSNFGDLPEKPISFMEGKIALEVDSMARKLRQIIKRLIILSQEMLSDDFIIEFMELDNTEDLDRIRTSRLNRIELQIVSDGTRTKKIAEMNMLLQGTRVMESVMTPEAMKQIYSDMYTTMGKKHIAMEILKEGSQQKQEISQLEQTKIQTEMLKQQKIAAEAAHLGHSDESERMRAMVAQVEAEVKARKMDSEIAKNYAVAENQKVKTVREATDGAEDLIKQ